MLVLFFFWCLSNISLLFGVDWFLRTRWKRDFKYIYILRDPFLIFYSRYHLSILLTFYFFYLPFRFPSIFLLVSSLFLGLEKKLPFYLLSHYCLTISTFGAGLEDSTSLDIPFLGNFLLVCM